MLMSLSTLIQNSPHEFMHKISKNSFSLQQIKQYTLIYEQKYRQQQAIYDW